MPEECKPICCRCAGVDKDGTFIPINEDSQAKLVCPNCATPEERGETPEAADLAEVPQPEPERHLHAVPEKPEAEGA